MSMKKVTISIPRKLAAWIDIMAEQNKCAPGAVLVMLFGAEECTAVSLEGMTSDDAIEDWMDELIPCAVPQIPDWIAGKLD